MQARSTVRVRSDGLWISADTLTLRDGAWQGTGVTWTACACAHPPWSLSAAEATIVPGEKVTLRGGWVRVFGVRVLPVPRTTFPLARHSGFLLPRIGFGVDGLRLAEPLYLTLGRGADLTLTPEVRTARSARLLGTVRWAARGGKGVARGAAGWDGQTGTVRGFGTWDQALARGPLLVATDGRWAGDPAYWQDYGDALLDRGQPFDHARALLGAGRFEADAEALRAWDSGTVAQVDLAWRQPVTDLGAGVLGGAVLGFGWTDPIEADGPQPLVARAHVTAERPTRLGVLMADAGVEGEATALGGVPSGWALARVQARLPAWRYAGRGLERLEPTVDVAVARAWGRPALGTAPPPWEVVPSVLWRRTLRDRWIEARAAVPITPMGARARLDADVHAGAWEGWAQVDAPVDEPTAGTGTIGLAWDGTDFGAAGGWLYAPSAALYEPGATGIALHQVWGRLRTRLPGPARDWEVHASVRAALAHLTWLHRGAGLSWTHPSGCVTLGVDLALDTDRAWPDVALVVKIRP